VVSGFIAEAYPQLLQDSKGTATLLHVLIERATYDDNVHVTPQWSGPPRTIAHIMLILLIALGLSLSSAFLAMYSKDLLREYTSIDVLGSAIERGRNRQQKLDSIVTWHLTHGIEVLPPMIHIAILLLGYALFQYFQEIDTTIGSAPLGFIILDITIYLSIIAAGTVYARCPYQTHGSQILRSAALAVAEAAPVISSTFRRAFECSETISVFRKGALYYQPWWSRKNIKSFLKHVLSTFHHALATDFYRLGRVVVQSLVAFAYRVYILSLGVPSTPAHGSDQQMTLSDLASTTWMFRASLDKDAHLSTLECLTTIAGCFKILVGHVKVINGRVVTTYGSQRFEMGSAICLLHTLSHLSVMDPMPTVLTDVSVRYRRVFSSNANYEGSPFYHILGAIHNALYPDGNRWLLNWEDYKPITLERVVVARALAKLAQSEYRRRERQRVPRWVLRFALHSLSQDPPPPTSVIVDCLSIIAIDLDCDVSRARIMNLDERYVHT
jgi:hypothetical protein